MRNSTLQYCEVHHLEWNKHTPMYDNEGVSTNTYRDAFRNGPSTTTTEEYE
eukprot:gene1690-1052_t